MISIVVTAASEDPTDNTMPETEFMPELEEIWQCQTSNCGYLYDPERGDRKGKIPRGVRFEDLIVTQPVLIQRSNGHAQRDRSLCNENQSDSKNR
jgi:rubredoxin